MDTYNVHHSDCKLQDKLQDNNFAKINKYIKIWTVYFIVLHNFDIII